MLLRLWLEAPNGVQIPILLARRQERQARKLFPPDVLAALVHDTAAPPWKDTLLNRPRSGLAVDPALLPDVRTLPSDELGQALRSRFSPIGPSIARSVCQWPDWHYPLHLVRLNSWWLPAGTARYPQGLFLIPADMIPRAELYTTQRLVFRAYLTRDTGIIPEWSFVLPCFLTRLSVQGKLAVVALSGASRELQARWVEGPLENWPAAVQRFQEAGITVACTPRWHMPLSPDATRGLWNAALALEAVCINHGILPLCWDGETVTGHPWDLLPTQWLPGRAHNLFEDVLRPALIGGLRVAFPVGYKGVPAIPERWFTLSVEGGNPQGPFLPAVESLWAESTGGSPLNRAALEKLAAWLVTLVRSIPQGWTGQLIPGPPERESPVFDWLLLQFTANDVSLTLRPFSAYNLPVEWLHEGVPEEVTTTTSTTGEPCAGTCRWNWSPGENTWVLMESDCSQGCFCVGPQECPGNGEAVTPCAREAVDPCTTTTSTTTSTTTPEPCAGSCTYRYNARSARWELVESACVGDGCHCDPSGLDCEHNDGDLVVRPCTREETAPWPECTTTTPRPCQGDCKWLWDPLSKRWVLSLKGCAGDPGCDCSPPDFCGQTAADCAYTPCRYGPRRPEPDCGQITTTTSTTSTTTPHPQCTGQCRWLFFLGQWRRIENPCLEALCPCPYPSRAGQNECDEEYTPCQRRADPTTTRYPPACVGECMYGWSSAQKPLIPNYIGWVRLEINRYHCQGPNCDCPEPEGAGQPCEIRMVPCRSDDTPPTTPAVPHCGAYCLWKYNPSTQSWSVHTSFCPSTCPCSAPTQPPQDPCQLVKTPCGSPPTTSTTSTSTTSTTTGQPTTTTTTTRAPCSGSCGWMCYNGVWSLVASTCNDSCLGCVPPEGDCAEGAVTNTGCLEAPTTTRDPNRCYGTCDIQCVCIDPPACTRGRYTVVNNTCTGDDCVCVSNIIGQPCDPRLRGGMSAVCEKATTSTTTGAPTSTTTTSSTTSTTTTTTTTSTTTTTTSSPTSSTTSNPTSSTTSQPGCSGYQCGWAWTGSVWTQLYNCQQNGSPPGCSCSAPQSPGSTPGQYAYTPCT